MTAAHEPRADFDAAIRASLAEKPDGVLEAVAETHGASLRDVMDRLPEGQAVARPGSAFQAIWSELTNWGETLVIVHTRDGVFEIKAALPPGSEGRGYFNIHGNGPLGGHLRADRCAAIYFVDRPFFGRRSCSIVFVNGEGGAMFKVFVARDQERNLLADQLAKFEALRAQPGA